MAGRIQEELQQKKPPGLVEEEAYLNIERTADLLLQRFLDLLRPYELTPTQYNVLRILRGSGEAGLNCKDVGCRMVTREPDITRLLDRLSRRGLISRDRAQSDRRCVTARITEEGLRMLTELDQPVHDFHLDNLHRVGQDRHEDLINTLEEIREGIG